jgi:hypothetical protein
MFEKKDPDTLLQSMTLEKMVQMPTIIPGSISCIGFKDSLVVNFALCLPNKENANQFLKAFGQLMKCRMGDNLKDNPGSTVKNILKNSCLGLDVDFDIKKYGGDVNLAKAGLQTAMNTAFENVAKNLTSFLIPQTPKDPLDIIDGKNKK